MRAIGRQLDQVDAAVFAREKSPDIRPFVVSGVVPDHVDDAFILIAVLNLGQQWHGTHAIHCDRRDERRIKGFKVQRAVNVDAGTACAKYTASSSAKEFSIFSYIAMNSACLATSATRGSVFGLRYSKPRRAKSLTQPE